MASESVLRPLARRIHLPDFFDALHRQLEKSSHHGDSQTTAIKKIGIEKNARIRKSPAKNSHTSLSLLLAMPVRKSPKNDRMNTVAAILLMIIVVLLKHSRC
jgi:hypothetical protein